MGSPLRGRPFSAGSFVPGLLKRCSFEGSRLDSCRGSLHLPIVYAEAGVSLPKLVHDCPRKRYKTSLKSTKETGCMFLRALSGTIMFPTSSSVSNGQPNTIPPVRPARIATRPPQHFISPIEWPGGVHLFPLLLRLCSLSAVRSRALPPSTPVRLSPLCVIPLLFRSGLRPCPRAFLRSRLRLALLEKGEDMLDDNGEKEEEEEDGED